MVPVISSYYNNEMEWEQIFLLLLFSPSGDKINQAGA
jgi:hypothetical protein